MNFYSSLSLFFLTVGSEQHHKGESEQHRYIPSPEGGKTGLELHRNCGAEHQSQHHLELSWEGEKELNYSKIAFKLQNTNFLKEGI